jgi:hypothetical protein
VSISLANGNFNNEMISSSRIKILTSDIGNDNVRFKRNNIFKDIKIFFLKKLFTLESIKHEVINICHKTKTANQNCLDPPVDGCTCPDKTYLNGGKCVTMDKCGSCSLTIDGTASRTV